MDGKKRGLGSGKGRTKGVQNKVTRAVRECIAIIAEGNVDAFQQWMLAIEDPAERCNVFLRMLEYHVPKLQRTEHTGEDGKELVVKVIDLTGRNAAT